MCFFFSRRPIHQAIGRSEKEDSEFYHSPSVLVYTFHLAFMTVFGFTSMHVQVSVNRFLQKFSNYCKMRSVCSREMNVGRWSGFLKNAFHAFVPKHKTDYLYNQAKSWDKFETVWLFHTKCKINSCVQIQLHYHSHLAFSLLPNDNVGHFSI